MNPLIELNSDGGCSDCCTKLQLEGCVDGQAVIQLSSIGPASHTTVWINTETGEIFYTKPTGFLTGACSASENSLAFGVLPPCASTPLVQAVTYTFNPPNHIVPSDTQTQVETNALYGYVQYFDSVTGYQLYKMDFATGDLSNLFASLTDNWAARGSVVSWDNVVTDANTTSGNLFFGSVTETPAACETPFITPKDNFTYFQTSDGTAAGNILHFWKYDLETNTWVEVPLGKSLTISDTVTGHKIADVTYDGVTTTINETITEVTGTLLPVTSHQIGVYHSENGTQHIISESVTSLNLIGTELRFTDENGVTGAIDIKEAETTTSVVDVVAGHKIASYIDENGTSTDINETITAISDAAYDHLTDILSFKFTDEAGVQNTVSVTIETDRYRTTSTTCNDVVNNQTATFIVGTGLSYTPEQDVIMYADSSNHMHGTVDSYDPATGVLVVDVGNHTGSGNFCSWTINVSGIQADPVETITTLTNLLSTGKIIATHTNEAGLAQNIRETITTLALNAGKTSATYTSEDGTETVLPLLNVLTTEQPTPTATGNTTNLSSVFKDSNGATWVVDENGDAQQMGVVAQTANFIVYIDTTTPSTATIFDENNNPPTTNNNAMKNRDDAIYIGTDGSTWTSNGTTYKTYSAAAATEWYLSGTTSDAGSDKVGAISRTGVVGIGGGAVTGSLLTLNQNATAGYGLVLKGNGVSGGSATGAKWVVGYNATGNKQHWFGDYDSFNATTGALVAGKTDVMRMIHVAGIPPLLDGQPLSTTGSGGLGAGFGAINIGNWRVGIGSESAGGNNTLPLYNGHIHGTFGVDNLPTTTTATLMLVWDSATKQVKSQLVNPVGGDDVYVNATDPSTATIFSSTNPPVVNNDANKQVTTNTYWGTDGSVWMWNGTAYVTKTYTYPTRKNDTFTATVGQTAFTLSKTPSGVVSMFRNGILELPASVVNVAASVTYTPANSQGGATYGALVAGDKIVFVYDAF